MDRGRPVRAAAVGRRPAAAAALPPRRVRARRPAARPGPLRPAGALPLRRRAGLSRRTAVAGAVVLAARPPAAGRGAAGAGRWPADWRCSRPRSRCRSRRSCACGCGWTRSAAAIGRRSTRSGCCSRGDRGCERGREGEPAHDGEGAKRHGPHDSALPLLPGQRVRVTATSRGAVPLRGRRVSGVRPASVRPSRPRIVTRKIPAHGQVWPAGDQLPLLVAVGRCIASDRCSNDGATGFARWPLQPAARQRSTSSVLVSAVKASTGVSMPRSRHVRTVW